MSHFEYHVVTSRREVATVVPESALGGSLHALLWPLQQRYELLDRAVDD